MENYFSDAMNHANENYSNYDGWDNADGDNDNDYNYATQGVGDEAKASLPFVINIANSTTNDVSSVVFLGANSNLFGATNFGNVAAITITMDNATVTYTEFLESIKSEPFKVGLMYLQSANTSQPFKQLTITTRDSSGVLTTTPITPTLDPMQNQAGVTIIHNTFPVNAYTKISTTILASATLTVRLYPSQKLDVSRGLTGKSVSKPFSKPGLSQLILPSRRNG